MCPAEGRAKDRQLLREHFRQLPDVDEEQEAGDADEDGGSDDEDGYDLEGGPSDDEEGDDQVRAAYGWLCRPLYSVSLQALAEALGISPC